MGAEWWICLRNPPNGSSCVHYTKLLPAALLDTAFHELHSIPLDPRFYQELLAAGTTTQLAHRTFGRDVYVYHTGSVLSARHVLALTMSDRETQAYPYAGQMRTAFGVEGLPSVTEAIQRLGPCSACLRSSPS